jgi:hypothetical protein
MKLGKLLLAVVLGADGLRERSVWNVPLSLTSHSMVPNAPMNRIVLHRSQISGFTGSLPRIETQSETITAAEWTIGNLCSVLAAP